MFEDSILESAHHLEARRGWSAVTAATLQMSVIAMLVLVPLLRPALIMPNFSTPRPIMTFVPRMQNEPAPHTATSNTAVVADSEPLHEPSRIPLTIVHGPTTNASPNPFMAIPCSGDCGSGSVITAINNAAPAKPGRPAVIRWSDFKPGQLLYRVAPEYPAAAKIARIQGDVILTALIGTDGSVQNLQVLSGHPMLTAAARRAVSQWKFRPYILDGAPIEVQTQITVHFTLSDE